MIGENKGEKEGIGDMVLGEAAKEMKRRKWRKWLDSGFYGRIVRAKIDGLGAKEELDLGRNEWRALKNRARRYIMVDGKEGRLV